MQAMLSTSNQIANGEYAAKIARILMGTFPQQEAKDCETYLGLLVSRLIGVPCLVLKEMIDPRFGLVAEARFLPTIAEVNAWLIPKEPHVPLPEHRLLPSLSEENVSLEERKRRSDMLLAVSKQIRAAANGMTIGRRVEVTFLTPEQQAMIDRDIADPVFESLRRSP